MILPWKTPCASPSIAALKYSWLVAMRRGVLDHQRRVAGAACRAQIVAPRSADLRALAIEAPANLAARDRPPAREHERVEAYVAGKPRQEHADRWIACVALLLRRDQRASAPSPTAARSRRWSGRRRRRAGIRLDDRRRRARADRDLVRGASAAPGSPGDRGSRSRSAARASRRRGFSSTAPPLHESAVERQDRAPLPAVERAVERSRRRRQGQRPSEAKSTPSQARPCRTAPARNGR